LSRFFCLARANKNPLCLYIYIYKIVTTCVCDATPLKPLDRHHIHT